VSKRPKRIQRIEVEWFDIEAGSGWGEGADQPPTVIQIGYIHAYPNKRQKIPCYRIKNSQVEDEPGGMTIIPKVNVVKVTHLGWVDVPWRE
jgi:hypothetical protein